MFVLHFALTKSSFVLKPKNRFDFEKKNNRF